MDEKFTITKQEKHLIKKERISVLRDLKYCHISKYPNDNSEFYEVYISTLKKYGFENSFESQLQNPFYYLAKYDKINQSNNKIYFIKLNLLLEKLKIHLEILEELKDTLPNSTVKTLYSNHKKYISKYIAEYAKSKQIYSRHTELYNINNDKSYKSIDRTLKIYQAYKEEPFYISLAIQASNDKRFDFLTSEYKENLQSLNKQIFSYKLKLSKKDIVKSFQAYAINLFHNDSIYNQLMKNDKTITNKNLVKFIGIISKHILDKNIRSPHVKNVDSQIYFIDILAKVFILKLSTTPQKRTKILSYNNLLLKFP